MKIQNKWTLGYVGVREHDREQPAENKNVHLCQVTQNPVDHKYENINDGDFQGLFYWEFSENEGEFVQRIELPVGEVPAARAFAPGLYHRAQATRTFVVRNLGSWGSAVPCVQTNQQTGTVKPIGSKFGGVDTVYGEKTMKFHGFQGEGSEVQDANTDRDVIKCATGTRQPSGFPMIAVQCLNSEAHEIIAFPTGNLLALDNSQNGLSTKVARVNSDGVLETDGEIASLGSIFLVIRDAENNKVVALQCGSSDEDVESIGHGAMLLEDIDGGNHLGYLGHTKGGPFIVAKEPHPDFVISPNLQNEDFGIAQKTSITTAVPFYQEEGRQGPFAFSDREFPVITGDGEVQEVIIVFDPVTRTWRLIVDEISSSAVTARVAWNHNGEIDLSEGQLIGDFVEDGVDKSIVWIDAEQSHVDFTTAGQGTIFSVTLVQKDHLRNGETRDLFRVSALSRDSGSKIKFLEVVDKSKRLYKLVSGATPWLDASPEIRTTIGNVDKDNIFQVTIPNQWDLSGDQNFRYLELNSEKVFRGVYAPVRPTPKDAETFTQDGIMQSLELQGDSAIAEYKINIERGNIDGKANAVTPGANMLPRFGDKDQSIILENIDQDAKKICKILSYSEESGVLEVQNLFNSEQNFTAKAVVSGVPNTLPSPESVIVDGIVTIHRVPPFDPTPEGQSSTGQTVEWISLFFLNREQVECEILVVDSLPIEGAIISSDRVVTSIDAQNFQEINVNIVRDFSVFSSGGVAVNNEEQRTFITVPGTFLQPIQQVKTDCDTLTENQMYFVTALPCLVDDVEAFIITGNANLSFNAVCCEESDGGGGDGGGGDGGDGGGGDTGGGEDPGGGGEDPGGGGEDPGGGDPDLLACPATATVTILGEDGVLASFSLPGKTLPNANPAPPSCNYSARNTEVEGGFPQGGVIANIANGIFTMRSFDSLLIRAVLPNPGPGTQFNISNDHRGSYGVTDKPNAGALADAILVEVG